MPGLVPGIHAVSPQPTRKVFHYAAGVDGRDKPGHDVARLPMACSSYHLTYR